MMNALLESLLVPEGATYTYFHRRLDDGLPFNWHYHREFELTLTLNSKGQRYVGDTIENYGDGDLALVGSNLPHTWMSHSKIDPSQPHIAHVFWIRGDWLDALLDTLIELRPLRTTLLNADRGMIFSEATSNTVRQLVVGMDKMTAAGRLIRLMEIFNVLGEAKDHRLLCAPRQERANLSATERPRIERALDHIHKHYENSDVSMTKLAELASLSVSGLHRLFKRHTRQSVKEYISQLKIGKACSLLVSTNLPISRIADEIGYGNLSHFNRQFLAIKGVSPREFRRSFHERKADGAVPRALVPGPLGDLPMISLPLERVPQHRGHPTGLAAIANSDL